MRLWWKRKGPSMQPPTERHSDAKRAQERARLSQREADIALVEMRAHGDKSKRERERNHFTPLIWKGFGGKNESR